MGRRWIKVEDWFRQDSVSVLAGASNTEIMSYKVPQNLTLRVMKFATYTAAAAYGYITWKMCHNRTPRYPFNAVMDPMGDYTSPLDIVPQDFPPASELSILADNSSGTNYNVGSIMRGELGYYE